MRMRMEGSSGARIQPKAPRQIYGQFETTAKVSSAAGCVTAFYVSVQSMPQCPIQHTRCGTCSQLMQCSSTAVSSACLQLKHISMHCVLQPLDFCPMDCNAGICAH